MDFSGTIDIIIKDLREIGEIVEDLRNYKEVPPLQLDIVKAKCKYAAEVMENLKMVKFNEEKIVAPEPLPETVPEKPALADKSGDISASIRSKPLSDIAAGIRMNERFLFIREIFSGNVSSYEEAIGKLDRAESLSDAKAIIMSYTGESKETEAVVQLLEIVRRKFPANG